MPDQVIDVNNIKQGLTGLAKGLIGVLIGLAGLMQIDAVKNFVTPIFNAHPKIAAVVAAAIGIGMLLQNPAVQKILHIDVTATSVKVSSSTGAPIASVQVPGSSAVSLPASMSETLKLSV